MELKYKWEVKKTLPDLEENERREIINRNTLLRTS
jgi:hypothetical protein